MPGTFALVCIGTCVAAWLVAWLLVPDIGGWLGLIPTVFAILAYRAYQRRST